MNWFSPKKNHLRTVRIQTYCKDFHSFSSHFGDKLLGGGNNPHLCRKWPCLWHHNATSNATSAGARACWGVGLHHPTVQTVRERGRGGGGWAGEEKRWVWRAQSRCGVQEEGGTEWGGVEGGGWRLSFISSWGRGGVRVQGSGEEEKSEIKWLCWWFYYYFEWLSVLWWNNDSMLMIHLFIFNSIRR